MHFNDALVGVLEVEDKKSGFKFDYDDLKLFQGFANICSAAIVNARKFMDVEKENRKLKEQISGEVSNLIGNSPSIKRIVSVIKKVARTDTVVLITGASGTGKEIIARSVHDLSSRKEKPFLQDSRRRQSRVPRRQVS